MLQASWCKSCRQVAREWRRSSSPALGLFLQSLPREMFARLPSWLGCIVWVLLFLFFKGFWVLRLFLSKLISLMGRSYHFPASCIYEQLRTSSHNGKSWVTFSVSRAVSGQADLGLLVECLVILCCWPRAIKTPLSWLERRDYCFPVKPGQGNVTVFFFFVAPSGAAGV